MRPVVASLSVAASLALLASAVPSPKYVKTDGTRFELDGKPYYFAGTNCYWCSFTAVCSSFIPISSSHNSSVSQNMSDVEIAFDAASNAGLNVIRTWGFNEV
jgi:mannan endo-1,4-beta-mannosidase